MAVIPFTQRLILRSRSRLVAMRASLVSSLIRIAVLGLLAALATVSVENSAVAWVLLIVVAVDALMVAWTRLLWPRKVPEGKDPVSMFWMTYLVSYSIAMTPALIGFVGVFLGAGVPVYVAGALASLVALAGIVPTQRYVEAFQQRLGDLGQPIDLHAAIRTTS